MKKSSEKMFMKREQSTASRRLTTTLPQPSTSCSASTTTNGNVVSFLLKGNTFTEFDFPKSTNTTALGVNQNDQIVGAYVDSVKNMHGFVLSSPLRNAHFQSVDDPKGVGTTTINGINDKGDLVGFYVDGSGNTGGLLATPKSTSSQRHSSNTNSQASFPMNLFQWAMGK